MFKLLRNLDALSSLCILSCALLFTGALHNRAVAQKSNYSSNQFDRSSNQDDRSSLNYRPSSINDRSSNLDDRSSNESVSVQSGAGLPRGINFPFSVESSSLAPPPGLRIEMSLSPPTNIPTNPYELGKYGQITVEYTRLVNLEGADMGLAAQALHVAHHLLFYSLGVSNDINSDGMFIFSVGLAHYQTGNNRNEPFVDAPFARFRFQSSPKDIFVYSEIETTMHFRSYISGIAGLGMRISPTLRIIGGYHHTEFVMPSEQMVQQVNGLEGIISWGM